MLRIRVSGYGLFSFAIQKLLVKTVQKMLEFLAQTTKNRMRRIVCGCRETWEGPHCTSTPQPSPPPAVSFVLFQAAYFHFGKTSDERRIQVGLIVFDGLGKCGLVAFCQFYI